MALWILCVCVCVYCVECFARAVIERFTSPEANGVKFVMEFMRVIEHRSMHTHSQTDNNLFFVSFGLDFSFPVNCNIL